MPDPKRAKLAEKLAQDVVHLDPAIMSLLILDKNNNDVLAIARSLQLPPEEYVGPELVKKLAVAARIVWGAAENASQFLGAREFIVGAFKSQLVLIVDLREYEMLLAMRLSRSSNAEHVYGKISSLLGLGGQSK